MVLLLFRENEPERGHRGGILALERRDLLVKVAQNHPFDRNGSGGDRMAAKQTGDETQNRSSRTAQVIAAAPGDTPCLQLGQKAGSVAALMVAEVPEFIDEVRRAPAGGCNLGGIDADRAMLAGMIDLHHPVREAFAKLEARRDCQGLSLL